MAHSRYKDASVLVSAFFDKDRFAEGGHFTALHAAWGSIVGERYAAHSAPSDVIKGILYIEVEHPGWIQLMQFKQAAILESVKRAYPELKLKSILFRMARDPKQRANPENASKNSVKEFPEDKIDAWLDTNRGKECDSGQVEQGVAPEVVSMLENLRDLVNKGRGA